MIACKGAPARAFELAAGLAAVEEGDDRLRPAAVLHLGINPQYAGRAYYYGRTYGPVTEATAVVAAVRRWGLFKSNTLTASCGLALMDEKTTLKFDDAADAAVHDKVDDQYNAGLAFGIAWTPLAAAKGPFYVSASWDSALFAAGLDGMILLSTGRKETLSLIMGVML